MESIPPEVTSEHRPHWNPTLKLIVILVMILLLATAIYLFRIVFVPLIIGAIIAYLLYPLVRRIRQSARLPHGLVTSILYLLIVALIVPIVAALIPVVIRMFTYLRTELIAFARTLQTVGPEQTIDVLGFELGVRDLSNEIATALLEFLRASARNPFQIVFGVAETALLAIFTFLIGYYLTRDTHQIIEWLDGLIPPGYHQDVRQLMAEINTIWASFFRGQLVLALVVTGIITALCTGLGLPQPVLMGVLAGLLEFLPSVGHTIWIITALIIALLEGSTYLPVSNVVFALLVAGAHFLFTQFDLNFLIPRIIGGHVRLHPMVVIIGIIVGATVGGVLGVALAAPTIATLRVIGRYVYAMLLDLDPFPMVGSPAAPKEERLAEQARLLEAHSISPPLPLPWPRRSSHQSPPEH